MKRNAIVRIILYSFLALTLTCVMIGGILAEGFSFGIDFDIGGSTVEDELSLEASQIKSIEIDWAAGAVEIRTADTDRITVQEVRSDKANTKMTYKLSGNTLQLNYGNAKISIGFGNGNIANKDLIITVPKDWVCEELEIDGASLDIDLQDLNVEKIDLDGAACTMKFTGCVDRVDIDGASADITLNCVNRISVINVDGASCDLDVILPMDCGFLVEMDGLSCSFYSDLDYSRSNGSYSFGDQHCRVNVDGISCDVSIQENLVWPITE